MRSNKKVKVKKKAKVKKKGVKVKKKWYPHTESIITKLLAAGSAGC